MAINPRPPLHHLTFGSGSPLLLLHGLFDNRHTWDALIPRLSHRFTLHAIDLPGFGKSPLPDSWPDSLSGMVDVIIEWLDAKGIERISLVGNSMGGGLSLAICEAHPQRVDRVVLLNPYGLPKIPRAAQGARGAMGGLLPYLLCKPAIRRCVKGIFTRAVFDKSRLSPRALEQRVAPFASLRQRKNLFRFLRALSLDAIEVIDRGLTGITQPVLILWGTEDGWLTEDHCRHLRNRLPHAVVQRIPACGHLPQIEKPDEVAAAVLSFLSRPETAAAKCGGEMPSPK